MYLEIVFALISNLTCFWVKIYQLAISTKYRVGKLFYNLKKHKNRQVRRMRFIETATRTIKNLSYFYSLQVKIE